LSASKIIVPPDSTGAKVRTVTDVVGADTVHSQIVDTRRGPCYVVVAKDIAPADNKAIIAVFNATGSGKKVLIHKAVVWNNAITAITGGEIQLRYIRITAMSGGTPITPVKLDTNNANLPAGITAGTNVTHTEAGATAEFFVHRMNTDETVGIANQNGINTMFITQFSPSNPRLESQQKIVCNEIEGFAIRQAGAITAGQLSGIILFEVI
jgi:hypothetical protein